MGRVGFRGKYQGLSFQFNKFEAPIRHSTRDAKCEVDVETWSFMGEVWPGDRTLGAMRLDEITWKVSADRKEKRPED